MRRMNFQRTLADRWQSLRQSRWLWPAIVSAAIAAAGAIVLKLEGRPWWCSCGQLWLWIEDIHSPHNSQHLLDPYSITHVEHGIALWCLIVWSVPRMPATRRFCLAILIETLWEAIENSDAIIHRYRAATIALGYEGDSMINSLGDIASCALGIALAGRLGTRASLVLLVVIELVLLFWIRDNLFLNILMLFHPIQAIKTWQAGG